MSRRKPMKLMTSEQARISATIDRHLTEQYVIIVDTPKGLTHRRVWGLALTVIRQRLREEGWTEVQTIDWAQFGFLVKPGRTLRGTKATVVTRQEPVESEREARARMRLVTRWEEGR